MKILILGNQARSTSNFWTVLMRRMRAAGHEVLCAVPAGDDAAEAAIRAIGEEDPAFRKGPAVRLCHYPLDRKGLNPLRDMATMHALYRLFRQEKPDLLFASTIKPVIYGCMAARLARVPHIYATITGLGYAFEADNFFKKCVNRLSIGLYHCALAGAEGVFFQNRDDAELFRCKGFEGGSFRDCTRVAALDVPLWRELMTLNSDALTKVVIRLEENIHAYRVALEHHDIDRVTAKLEYSSNRKRRMNLPGPGQVSLDLDLFK